MNALKLHRVDCKASSKTFMLSDYQSAESKLFPLHFCRCCRCRLRCCFCCRYMHLFDMSSFVCVCALLLKCRYHESIDFAHSRGIFLHRSVVLLSTAQRVYYSIMWNTSKYSESSGQLKSDSLRVNLGLIAVIHINTHHICDL